MYALSLSLSAAVRKVGMWIMWSVATAVFSMKETTAKSSASFPNGSMIVSATSSSPYVEKVIVRRLTAGSTTPFE